MPTGRPKLAKIIIYRTKIEVSDARFVPFVRTACAAALIYANLEAGPTPKLGGGAGREVIGYPLLMHAQARGQE